MAESVSVVDAVEVPSATVVAQLLTVSLSTASVDTS